MKMIDSMDIQGRLIVQKHTLNHHLVEECIAHNTIVETGRDLVAKLFVDAPIKPISVVAVGTGDRPVTPSDPHLEKPIFKKEITRPKTIQPVEVETATGTIVRKKVTIALDLDPDEANETLREAGLFNSDNVMYNRVVLSTPIQKTSDFRLTLLWEILF